MERLRIPTARTPLNEMVPEVGLEPTLEGHSTEIALRCLPNFHHSGTALQTFAILWLTSNQLIRPTSAKAAC